MEIESRYVILDTANIGLCKNGKSHFDRLAKIDKPPFDIDIKANARQPQTLHQKQPQLVRVPQRADEKNTIYTVNVAQFPLSGIIENHQPLLK